MDCNTPGIPVLHCLQEFAQIHVHELVYHISLIHPLVDGHLGPFYFLATMNNVAMNIFVQVFAWTYAFSSLRYMPRSETAGL